MIDLTEFLVKSLVDKPESANISQIDKNDTIVLELRVAPEDMGKIIGKQGRIAKAVRTLVKAAAAKEGKKVVVEII